jgi:hypothetical protein
VRAEDGFYQEEVKDTPEGIKKKQRVIKKIPTEASRRIVRFSGNLLTEYYR